MRLVPITLFFLTICLLAGVVLNDPLVVAGAYEQFRDIATISSSLPINGWTICADLGNGNIPGLGSRQRFRICQAEGWEILAFCLEVDKPAPQIGSQCSFVNSTDLWCGESVQYLRQFDVIQTPAPTRTRTVTPTRTIAPTLTSSPTMIRTSTRSTSRTPTTVSLKSQQAPVSVTRLSGLGSNQGSRPRPGGPGNLESVLLPLTTAALAILAAVWILKRSIWKHPAANQQKDHED